MHTAESNAGIVDVATRVAPPYALRRSPPLVAWFIALAIVCGAGLRFVHLGTPPLWDAEVATVLHAQGISEYDAGRLAPHIATAGAANRLVHPARVPRASPARIAEVLAADDPLQPPGFAIALQAWMQRWGASAVAVRALSAVIGLAALGAMFWLCWEIWASAFTAWVAVALLAISPAAVVGAREVGETQAWLLGTLVMAALFVRALRHATTQSWLAYALATAASAWLCPLALVVALGNLVTAAAIRVRGRLLLDAMLASAAALLAFAPWLSVLVSAAAHVVARMCGAATAAPAARDAARGIVGLLAPLLAGVTDPPRGLGALAVALATASVVALGMRRIARRDSAATATFVLVLGAANLAALAVIASLAGPAAALNGRWAMPFDAACIVALAALFGAEVRSTNVLRRRSWLAVFAAVLANGALSSVAAVNASAVFTHDGEAVRAVARAIDAAPAPLVIAEDRIERPLALAGALDPAVPLLLRPRCERCAAPTRADIDGLDPAARALALGGRFRTVIVLSPSPGVETQLLIGLPAATAYRCIYDRRETRRACAGGPLALWPPETPAASLAMP